MSRIELLQHFPWFLIVILLVVDVWATGHVLLFKRDTRAAIAWVGYIWFVPLFGSLLYFLLGINRIKRRARSLMNPHCPPSESEVASSFQIHSDELATSGSRLPNLARIVEQVTCLPLTRGNDVRELGPQTAYSEMLASIEQAQSSIALCTYIFDRDPIGRRFVEALAAAQKRSVEVRVLIDDVGARYSWPSIFRWLRNEKISAVSFMPTWIPWIARYANLRNHRKLLIVDGATCFTGGMNIRASQSIETSASRRTEDLHFRMQGPVVGQMQNVFVEDWRFTTGESLSGANWFPEIASHGDVLARSVSAGPDEEYERLRMTILAALSCAEKSVRIVTPYFVPDRDIITALNLASMRGVGVDILLPQVNNLCFVQWASTAILWQVLERGCRVWYVPPPFDHTKLMLVDGVWTFLGSSNWDARSLRLNFELNVECYDQSLTRRLELIVEEKRSRSTPITLADVDGRSVPRKLRDGLARLLSPYL